jgi:hypothetical protein
MQYKPMDYQQANYGDNGDMFSEDRPGAQDLNAQIFLGQLMEAMGSSNNYTPKPEGDDMMGEDGDGMDAENAAETADETGLGDNPFGDPVAVNPLGDSASAPGGPADDPFGDNVGAPPMYDENNLKTSNELLNQLAAPSLTTIGSGNYPSPGGDVFSGDMMTRLRRLVRKL